MKLGGVPHCSGNGHGWFPPNGPTPTPAHLLTTTVSLRLGHTLHCHLLHCRISLLHSCSLTVMGIFKQKSHNLRQFNLLQWSNDAVSAACSSCLCFFGGNPSRKEIRAGGGPSQEIFSRSPSSHRRWTNFLLAINVLVYVVQIATQGKLMLWGAKINSLIDKGQFWRLVTSSFLHANVGHLMVNCYSLNSIGPTVENICGTQRFFTIYFTSAVASSAMSYWLSSAPAVGASGAIFGLVGSVAVFSLRHRSLFGYGKEDLQHIAQVIVLNMMIGLLSKGIDNWGHVYANLPSPVLDSRGLVEMLGGLLGGAAVSWLVGPAWKYQYTDRDGRRVFADRAPITYLTRRGP